ncbi:MAG: uracil phosphoribosyltransferase [Candidatus Gottesmanbacteria bacterium]|nr:uracil phosphoribosyltransferase [Candidatus Gottesmanbacteria bacterium]
MTKTNRGNVICVSHPLVEHSLTVLRDYRTTTEEFRRHADTVSKIILIEATKHLSTKVKNIETPLAPFTGRQLNDKVIVVPVLRAGLAMLIALRDFLPAVSVGFIGLERDEQTAQAREYYQKMPKIFASHIVMVIDPMLATGGSFDNTVAALKKKGAKRIVLVSIVSAPEGVKLLQERHPDVMIITGAIDDHLNAKKFIVPGLGDFGDRYFGT